MKSLAWICLVVLASCAANSNDSKSSARTVAAKELPPDHQRALSAYARGGETWELERKAVLADKRLCTFVVENLALELIKAHRALAGADADRALPAFQRAREELVRFEAMAIPTLVGLLEVADAVAATTVASVLTDIGQPAVEALEPLLSASSSETRRRAAAALEHLPHAGNRVEGRVRAHLIECFERESDWATRTALARAIGARGSRDADVVPWRNALQAGLLDADVLVAEASAEGLANLGDARAVPVLIDVLSRASQHGDLRRFQAVQTALVRLTHQPEKGSVEAWRAWWDGQPRR
ncbi:MAG: HEAT repeat domain-containing protein [Planctomycetes bacterium]|nr:HEAT repeat domain-containing protein [Planctomycetota bacterium]